MLRLIPVCAAVLWTLSPTGSNSLRGQTTVPPASPTGDEYRTHLSTDRRVYLPGESVFIRGVLLDYRFHRPLSDRQRAQALVEICGDDGILAKSFVSAKNSVLGLRWLIPKDQAAGDYKVLVRYPWSHHPPAERSFRIARPAFHPLDVRLRFKKSTVSPEERVEVDVVSYGSDKKPIQGGLVEAFLTVDKVQTRVGEAKSDARGRVHFAFSIPKTVRRPQAQFDVKVTSDKVVDTARQTLNIVPARIRLRASPESGHLISGIRGRVYISARLPDGDPLAVSGIIVDQNGQRVGSFVTDSTGLGVFPFTPRAGMEYRLRPRIPNHLTGEYPMGTVRRVGVVLEFVGASRDRSKVKFLLRSNTRQPVVVTLRQANKDVAAKIRVSQIGTLPLEFATGGDLDGALVATVWTEDGRPLAERLVFQRSSKRLKVELTSDKKFYRAGKEVRLTIRTRDEANQPIQANLGIGATAAFGGRQSFVVAVLLEDEVERVLLSDPLSIDSPDSALDRLMGNQDWRRFAFSRQAEFAKRYGERALRVLARNAREKGGLRSGKVRLEYIPELRVFLIKGEAGAVKEAKALIQAIDRRKSPLPRRNGRRPRLVEVAVSGERLKALTGANKATADEDEKPRLWPARSFTIDSTTPDNRTVFWAASIQTDAQGKATVRFPAMHAGPLDLSVDAFDARGRIGAASVRRLVSPASDEQE